MNSPTAPAPYSSQDIDWAQVRSDGTPPPGWDADDLVADLLEMLASPDPHLRDEIGHSVLSAWIMDGRVSEARLEQVGDVMSARLAHPEVHVRSFAALILAVVVHRGVVRPEWVDAVEHWYVEETDLRGHDPQQGWLHAVAHGADLLGELGLSPHADPARVLRIAADRLTRTTDHVFRDHEDERLAHAIAGTLTRTELSEREALSWLDSVEDMLTSKPAGPSAPAISNALGTLRMLFVLTCTGVRTGGDEPVRLRHQEALQHRLLAVLHVSTPWMW